MSRLKIRLQNSIAFKVGSSVTYFIFKKESIPLGLQYHILNSPVLSGDDVDIV